MKGEITAAHTDAGGLRIMWINRKMVGSLTRSRKIFCLLGTFLLAL